MEYIRSEEFLKQPKEVQEVFLEWWEPNKDDLVQVKLNWTYKSTMDSILKTDGFNIAGGLDSYTKKDVVCPLLTEGQLRKFIEDKTGCKICLEYYKTTGYEILLSDIEHNKENAEQFNNWYEDLGTDLLQAYWKVACEIAKGE